MYCEKCKFKKQWFVRHECSGTPLHQAHYDLAVRMEGLYIEYNQRADANFKRMNEMLERIAIVLEPKTKNKRKK